MGMGFATKKISATQPPSYIRQYSIDVRPWSMATNAQGQITQKRGENRADVSRETEGAMARLSTAGYGGARASLRDGCLPLRREGILNTALEIQTHKCGHRQVVRHQLPKLTLAGSSPVARSI